MTFLQKKHLAFCKRVALHLMPPFFLCNRHYEGDDGDDRASVPTESVLSDIAQSEGEAIGVASADADFSLSTIGLHDISGEHCCGDSRD